MLDFSADQVLAGATVVGLLGTAIVTVGGWVLHAKDAAQEREMTRINISIKEAWSAIDKLKEERGIYSTREDQERWRQEFKADNAALRAELKSDLGQLGISLTHAIEEMSNRFARQVERLMGEK